MKNYSAFHGKYNKSLRFIIVFATLFLAYKTLFFFVWRSDFLFELYVDFSLWWINGLLTISDILLKSIGYSTEVIESTRIVKIIGTSGVTVGEPCIGFDIMALFIGLILSLQLSFRSTIQFILIVLLMINTLNVLRISALAVLVQYDPYLWEINHKFIFTFTIYVIMFFTWRRFLNPTTLKVS